MDFLTTVLGTSLRLIYLFPFLNYFIIANREKKFFYSRSQKIILSGILLTLVNIAYLFIAGQLAYTGVIDANTNAQTQLLIQLISNLLMTASFLMLLGGMYELYMKEVTRQDLHNSIILIIAVGTAVLLSNKEFLFRLSIITYIMGMYFLIRSLLITGFIIKEYQKNYYLIILGALILILDPMMYINASMKLTLSEPDFMSFYFFKQIGYLIGASAMILIATPNVKFLLKLAKKEVLGYESDDSLVENTIKRLLNETQTVYGSMALSVLDATSITMFKEQDKKIKCVNGNMKGVNYRDQKEYFKALLKEYSKMFSQDLLASLLKNIKDTENESLIKECLSVNPIENDGETRRKH